MIAVSLRVMNVSSRMFSVNLSTVVKSLRWVSYAGLAGFLMWYIPNFIDKFKAEEFVLEGEMARFHNNNTEAITKYQQAIQREPRHPIAQFSLSSIMVSDGNYREAKKNTAHLLVDYPWYPKAHLLAAVSSFELGDTSEGLNEISKEMSIDDAPQTYYYAGYFAYRLHQSETEYRMLTTLLQKNIESKISDFAVPTLDRLSDVCREQQKERECLDYVQKMQQTFTTDSGLTIKLHQIQQKLSLEISR